MLADVDHCHVLLKWVVRSKNNDTWSVKWHPVKTPTRQSTMVPENKCPKCGSQLSGVPSACRNDHCSNFGESFPASEPHSPAVHSPAVNSPAVDSSAMPPHVEVEGTAPGQQVRVDPATWSWEGAIAAASACAGGRVLVLVLQGVEVMAIATPISAFVGLLIGALVGGLGRPLLSPILGGALSWFGTWLMLWVYRLFEVALTIITIGAFQSYYEGEAMLSLWMAVVGAASGALGAAVAKASRRPA